MWLVIVKVASIRVLSRVMSLGSVHCPPMQLVKVVHRLLEESLVREGGIITGCQLWAQHCLSYNSFNKYMIKYVQRIFPINEKNSFSQGLGIAYVYFVFTDGLVSVQTPLNTCISCRN